jgi:serine/threonine protein phosphatase PrpC
MANVWQEIDKLPEINEATLRTALLAVDLTFLTTTDSIDGSTAIFAVVQREGETQSVIVGNIGDSRAILASNGQARPLSEDHKPENEGEKKRILSAGGFVALGRVGGDLALSRALGDRRFKSDTNLPQEQQQVSAVAEFQSTILKSTDYLLLVCDGLVERLTNQDLIDFIEARRTETDDLAAIMGDLITHSLRSGSTDNMSAMMICPGNGTDYHREENDFIPGPIFSGADFQNAWIRFAQRSGLSEAAAQSMLQQASQSSPSTMM